MVDWWLIESFGLLNQDLFINTKGQPRESNAYENICEVLLWQHFSPQEVLFHHLFCTYTMAHPPIGVWYQEGGYIVRVCWIVSCSIGSNHKLEDDRITITRMTVTLEGSIFQFLSVLSGMPLLKPLQSIRSLNLLHVWHFWFRLGACFSVGSSMQPLLIPHNMAAQG